MSKWLRIKLGSMLSVAAVAGCMNLDVMNNAAPTAAQILDDPEELQALVVSSWHNLFWQYTQGSAYVYRAMPFIAGELASGSDIYQINGGPEPREAYGNNPTVQTSTGDYNVSQRPWYGLYEAVANVCDALWLIENQNKRIVQSGTDNTDRIRAYSWFLHGASYSILALGWDRATLRLPDTDVSKPGWWQHAPYTEVADFAIRSLERAIEIAESSEPFTIPAEWFGGVSLDNEGLIRLAHTYIAKTMVYLPRNPAERKDVSEGGIVDWDKVITHAQKGIVSDFAPTLSSTGLQTRYMQVAQTSTQSVAHPMLYGPADMSGAYAEWLAKPLAERDKFRVVTDDRRISPATSAGAPNPTGNGKYFRYVASGCCATSEGYQRSFYYWRRNNGAWSSGVKVTESVDELNLLIAEAHLRRGRLQEAIDLINITRVANGELPPVTTAGVPGDINACVPRTFDGTACGTLLDALHHERMMELTGLNMWRSWWDRRGFGTLIRATYTQLPIPYRELGALEIPFYTFGGSSDPTAADGLLQVR